MKVRYDNEQDNADPMNGTVIAGSAQLIKLLNSRRHEPPFFARLSGDNGYEIMIGIGGDLGCGQYSRSDGDPPYLMAVSARPPIKSGYLEFLTANTPTPVAARYIVSFDELTGLAVHFLQTGERSDEVSWRVLEPGAIREDIERG